MVARPMPVLPEVISRMVVCMWVCWGVCCLNTPGVHVCGGVVLEKELAVCDASQQP